MISQVKKLIVQIDLKWLITSAVTVAALVGSAHYRVGANELAIEKGETRTNEIVKENHMMDKRITVLETRFETIDDKLDKIFKKVSE